MERYYPPWEEIRCDKCKESRAEHSIFPDRYGDSGSRICTNFELEEAVPQKYGFVSAQEISEFFDYLWPSEERDLTEHPEIIHKQPAD